MSKSKKRLLVVLAAVMAFALAAAILLFNPVRTAFAARSSTAWTTIGEIYNDSTKGFNEDNLKKLYKALTGTDTFASVQTAANSGKTSADFRLQNSGSNNVSVWFGGKKWDAVYLTTAQNGGGDTQKGDVILDLWQSADNINKQKVGFLDWDAERTDVNDTYPANMYSTSTLRVKTLNAGGYCLTSKNTLGTKQEQDSNNQYARFTMSTVGNSLTKYIATPAEVGYQEHEFDADSAEDIANQVYKQQKKYYLPNDAYGAPNTGGEWYSTDYGNLYNSKDGSRVDEAKYGAWKDDYLWIPSITEAGCSATGSGLWKTDFSLRSSAGTQGTDWTWFRSGYSSDEKYSNTDYYFFVFVIGVLDENNNHADWSNLTSTDPNFVRPALHLNLTAANGNVGSAWKSIGEIYQDGSNSFNRDNMQALYTALTGSGSYGDVRTALNGGNKTSADFRTHNGGQNVQVEFGGIKWDAVYLTKATNGDFILDLWQSVDSITETNVWAGKNNVTNNPDALYPDNMYSASSIRVITLNAGGEWASDNGAITPASQSSRSPYARFTMSTVSDSLTNYIVKPVDVGYQETEFDSVTAKTVGSSGCYLPNDAYGTPTGGQWAKDSSTQISYDYSDKPNYDAWKNDYIWLPSITEAGCSASGTGLWKTDATLRNSGTIPVWTRSGDDNWAANAYALEPTGNNQHYYVNYSYAVRPAIHLNLTAINNSLKQEVQAPTIAPKTYTGYALNAVDVKSNDKYTVSNNSNTEVGTYSVVLTLKEPDDYKWKDNDPNEKSITLQFEITTAENSWKYDAEVPNGGWTYGDNVEHTPLEPYATPKYGEDTRVYTYTHEDDPNGTYYEEMPTAVGHYYFKATVPAGKSTKDPSKNNYNELVSDPVRFEIKPATLTATGATVATKTYDGTTTATIAAFTFEGYKYDDEAAINVAEYTAAYESANAANSVKVTISKITLGGTAAGNYTVDLTSQTAATITGIITPATLKIAAATVETKTYDGTTAATIKTMSFSDIVKGDESKVKFSSCTAEFESANASQSATVVEITDVKLTGEAADNYVVDASTLPNITGVIEQATLTITGAAVATKPYDGTTAATISEFTFDGYKVGADNDEAAINVAEYTAAYASANAGTSIRVTITSIMLGGTAAGNYTVDLTSQPATIAGDIERASLNITGATVATKPYDGKTTANITAMTFSGYQGSDSSGNVQFSSCKAEFESANASDSATVVEITDVKLTGEAADNYVVDTDDLPAITGNITKKTVEVVWSGYSDLVYNGNSQTITASATGVLNESVELIVTYVSDTLGVELVGGKPQNAGTYTATASTENGNYALSGNTITYVVEKRQVTAPTIAGTVYNGTPQTAQVAYSELYSVAEVTETNAGDYSVTITLIHPENYKWTTSEEAAITVIFTIKKAIYDMAGVSFDPVTITYDAHEHSIFVSGDLPKGVEVTYDGNGQTEVGAHVVTAYFTGDAQNYELIPEKTAILTIKAVSHDLSKIIFADVTVKYDGEEHSVYIEGDLPTGVSVEYEGNGQVDPAIYTIIASFVDPDGVAFDSKTATLTILRTQTQTAPKEESGEGGSGGEGGLPETDVYIESEEGFDPTLELVVKKAEDASRSYLAWGKDEVSERYSVKLCNQDGEEVPIEGKVTVRLLIPEAFRNKDFDLMALAKSGAATASYDRGGVQTVAVGAAAGATSVSYTRDGDYVVFEADGLSDYVFTSSYTPYFPILIAATVVLFADVAAMTVLAVVIRKKLQRRAR